MYAHMLSLYPLHLYVFLNAGTRSQTRNSPRPNANTIAFLVSIVKLLQPTILPEVEAAIEAFVQPTAGPTGLALLASYFVLRQWAQVMGQGGMTIN
jgi:hypothetical protein